jgi:hypothetical protein
VKVIPAMVESLIERVAAGEFDSQLSKKKAPKAKSLGAPVDMKKASAGKRRAA